jgi:hypothetical protein
LFRDPINQAIFGTVVLFVSLLMQVWAAPYELKVNNQLEFISIIVPLIILYAGLLFLSGK